MAFAMADLQWWTKKRAGAAWRLRGLDGWWLRRKKPRPGGKESHMCHSELRCSSEGMAVWRDNL